MPFFFFNDTATTEIYTLSLHDALPIYGAGEEWNARPQMLVGKSGPDRPRDAGDATQRLLDSHHQTEFVPVGAMAHQGGVGREQERRAERQQDLNQQEHGDRRRQR